MFRLEKSTIVKISSKNKYRVNHKHEMSEDIIDVNFSFKLQHF